MARYLLDTNHLSPLVTYAHPLRAHILSRLESGDQFTIPVVVLSEFLFGIQVAPRAQANQLEWDRLQSSFGYYPIGRIEAEAAARLQAAMRRRGRQIGTIAIHRDLILLTTDRDFEPIPRLKRENWIPSHR